MSKFQKIDAWFIHSFKISSMYFEDFNLKFKSMLKI